MVCYYTDGDDMKKTLTYMTVAILFGGLCGKILYQKYEDTSLVFHEEEKVYFLQEGVYSSEDSLNRNTKDISPKLVAKENDQYYVYVGISKSKDGIEKIKDIYEEKGYTTYQKEKNVTDESFLTNLSQYDILLDSAKTSDDILTIQEVVLSNYEEIGKK